VAPMKFDLAPISCRLLVEGVCLAVLASSDWTRQLAACDARLSEKKKSGRMIDFLVNNLG